MKKMRTVLMVLFCLGSASLSHACHDHVFHDKVNYLKAVAKLQANYPSLAVDTNSWKLTIDGKVQDKSLIDLYKEMMVAKLADTFDAKVNCTTSPGVIGFELNCNWFAE